MIEGMAVTRQSKMGLGLASHALLAERRCTGLQASLVAAGREAVVELCGIFAGKPEARSRCPLPRTGLRRRSEGQGKTRGCAAITDRISSEKAMARIIIEKDIEIPMRDGCVLKGDLYRPDSNEKLPVLLNRTPYDKKFPLISSLTLDSIRAAQRGYNVVFVDCRGRFASQGTFTCFVDEPRDGYDTIEWLARQPFADGKGGAFALYFNVSWTMISLGLARLMREREENPAAGKELETLMGSIDHMCDRMDFMPLREFPMFRAGAPYFFDWLEHPYYDDYWRKLCIEEYHDKIAVPTLNIGGWYDIFQGGTIRNHLGMRAHGASEAARSSRLMLGPWSHGLPLQSLVGQVDMGFRSSPVSVDLDGMQLDFFDSWLKGKQNVEVTGPITLTLYASSSASDTDFTGKLVDVDQNGFARNLTDGIIRARVRESQSEPKLINPGKVYEFTIDMWSTSNLFKAGHRIRLEVSSSNFPRFDRNPNTGHELFVDAETRPALQTVMHERGFGSYVTLPVIPKRA